VSSFNFLSKAASLCKNRCRLIAVFVDEF
jgi:hypothetical protein